MAYGQGIPSRQFSGANSSDLPASPLIHLRLELEGGAVVGVHLFDARVVVLDGDDLDIDPDRAGAEAFDDLAEVGNGLVGEALRLGVVLCLRGSSRAFF